MQQRTPPWLALALDDVGTAEVPGKDANPKILAYFADVGRPDIKDDETAWCAAATGSWLRRCGLPLPAPAVALLAQSYRTYGMAVPPQPGAIGVWPRGSADWMGHVGLVVDVDEAAGTCRLVSGNTSNKVAITTERIDKALAFRWPVKPTVAALRQAGSTEIKAADKIEFAGAVGGVVAVGGTGVAIALRPEEAAPPPVVAVPDATPVQPPPLDPPLIDPDALGWLDQAVAVLKALGGSLAAHPWVMGAMLAALILLVVGRAMKRKRVAKALAGAPLSIEMEAAQ